MDSNGFKKFSDLGARRLVMLAAVKGVCNLANIRDTWCERPAPRGPRPRSNDQNYKKAREPKLESTGCRQNGHSDVAL
jgi:hypothetical protein